MARPVHQASKVCEVHLASQVFQAKLDLLVKLANPAHKVNLDKLVHRVCLVIPVFPARPDYLVQRVPQVPKALQVVLVWRALWVPVASLVRMDYRASPVKTVWTVPMVSLVLMVKLVLQVYQEPKVTRVNPV